MATLTFVFFSQSEARFLSFTVLTFGSLRFT